MLAHGQRRTVEDFSRRVSYASAESDLTLTSRFTNDSQPMKRCPQCNRVETDHALAFCRVDGGMLVSDSSSIDQEAGTVKLGSGSVPSEVVAGPLPHSTNANFNRATAATTVLPPPAPQTAFTDLRITTKRRPSPKTLAVIGTAIVAIVVTVVVITFRTRSSAAAIRSIAVMPFVNASGNADLYYLSDGMTEMVIKRLSQLPNLPFHHPSS